MNSKLFPLLEQASPTLLLQQTNVTTTSDTRPLVLMNIVKEKSQKEQEDDHINWNIFGLEYLAELQNKFGVDEKVFEDFQNFKIFKIDANFSEFLIVQNYFFYSCQFIQALITL